VADNIGKVQIAIEAQTKDLKAGLASAERAVKDSAKKMEKTTESLGQKAEKSWTEFASKMGVVQQIGAIAQQAWNALDGVLSAVTDSSANASQKLTGAMDAIEQAGVPVVSQFLAIGRGIYDWISGEKKLREEVSKRVAQQERVAKKQIASFNERLEKRKALTESTDAFVKALKDEAEMAGLATDREKLLLQQQRDRHLLNENFNNQMKLASKNATEQFINEEKRKFAEAEKLFRQKQERELKAFDEAQAGTPKEEKKIDEETIRAKTQELEIQLKILEAKKRGDETEARRIAIVAKFDKMKLNATKEQIKLLEQMQAIELENIKTKKEGSAIASSGSGGTTASISTAIGSFTVAEGSREQKKQTSLLEKIARSNEKVARTISDSSSSGIILAR
tara:strand:- start:594 stop:1775 length:1182 start_codon:yes stop_codon:yes gene_type:complete